MTAITKPRKEGWETTGVVWNMSSVLREVWPILELEEQGFGIINWDWSYYITQLGHSKYLSSGEGRPSAMAKGKRSHWREASWRKGTENRVQELSETRWHRTWARTEGEHTLVEGVATVFLPLQFCPVYLQLSLSTVPLTWERYYLDITLKKYWRVGKVV